MNGTDVKVALTPRHRRHAVENDAYHAFARRVVHGYARRVGEGDVEALATIVALSDELDRAIHAAVHGLLAFGYSWAEIAARLGGTRQSAWQRWNAEPTTTEGDPR